MFPLFAVAAIFMYHHVSPTIAPGPYQRALTVAPDEFRLQLAWLRDHGCAVRTVSEVLDDVRTGSSGTCDVALSFDDGYADAAAFAQPLLERDGFRGTFYVATGFVGTSGHLSARQIASLAGDGMEVGAHTVSHRDLATLSVAGARSEIDDSKTQLERWTGAAVTTFAYPAGSYTAAVEQIVKSAGFRSAVSTQSGPLTERNAADPFALPRYRIMRGQGIALFRSVLGPLAVRRASNVDPQALIGIARRRIEGNDSKSAERVAVALLERAFPEQILKVKILNEPPARVAGIMLSGVKFHAPVSSTRFATDAAAMVDRAFAADARITEVDLWTVVPLNVAVGATVSGDLARPTSRTVFSLSALRPSWLTPPGRAAALRETFWDEAWQKTLAQR